jgi:dTDP-4-dehydrorhamnose reductase
VKPCSTDEMPRPATRPAYSVLRSERGEEAPVMPGWQEGLACYMALRASAPGVRAV